MSLLPLTTKEKSTPKKPLATQANTQQAANAIRNTCLCFHVQSSALVASFSLVTREATRVHQGSPG